MLSYLSVVGHAFSAAVMPYSWSGMTLSTAQQDALRATVAARMIGYNLGAATDAGSETTIMSQNFIASSPPVRYSTTSIGQMSAEIEAENASRGPLPTLDVHPVGVFVAAQAVTLAWDFGDAGDAYTVYRAPDSVPISCFDCDSFIPAQNGSHVDLAVAAGATYRYRVVARGADGRISAVSAEVAVEVPSDP